MKRRTDQEQLLNDVLADEADAGLNASALDQLLQLARRRRRERKVWRVGGALVVVAVVMFAFAFQSGGRKSKAARANKPIVPPSCEIVTSVALMPEQLISSRPLSPEQIVRSVSGAVVVQTTANVPSVNDEELLELAKPNIAVLVRRSPREMELVFVEASAANN
jgi:hypothetical protein